MKIADFLSGVGRPVAYFPSLTPVTGGVTATLLLCQLLYWDGKGDDPDGWIYKTQEELTSETGLSRREQEHARSLLKDRGLLQEKLAKVPARLHYRIDKDVLHLKWTQTSMAESAKLDCTKPPNKYGGKRQTILSEITTEITQKEDGATAPDPPSLKVQERAEETDACLKPYYEAYARALSNGADEQAPVLAAVRKKVRPILLDALRNRVTPLALENLIIWRTSDPRWRSLNPAYDLTAILGMLGQWRAKGRPLQW